ncbi:PepSY domain-containing protein [Rhodobacter ferrooxidans]|uniref:PepSY domain-containing protein n=1 Tax=Rhodobacter ferrooxidans TaxID=371731 RepID=C8RZP8_9RHOB|nr:PepSY domain-containing protein [Rhodobacter sp. SW2]EEW25845.1 conserved hypothetical protein [Rhodobacter sp. SW2]
MKRKMLVAGVLVAGLLATAAYPGDDCTAPMSTWQPREVLAEKVRALGWEVDRIRTDDGCYKVYGRDETGKRIEAEFDPATLELLELEQHDDDRRPRGRHGAGHDDHGEPVPPLPEGSD